MFRFINYPTRFDARDAQKALKGSGISVPRLEDYAWRLWDYWERHLDPDLFIDRSLAGKVRDKVVVLTGGTSGIGEATVYKLCEAGANVVVVARDGKRRRPVIAKAKSLGGGATFVSCDLSDMADCDKLVATVKKQFGRADYLVNNAGRSIRRGIASSYDRFHDFERTMALNYFGSLRLTMGFLPMMVEQGGGHIINISSIGVLTRAPRFSRTCLEGALDAWSDCAASEFQDNNVAFTTINMPLVRTPMIAPTSSTTTCPTLTPEQAADLVVQAIVYRPGAHRDAPGASSARSCTPVAPKGHADPAQHGVSHVPDSSAAKGRKGEGREGCRAHARASGVLADHSGYPLVRTIMAMLKPGDPAPDFDASTTDGKRVSLKDYRGRKLVMYFYPMDDTPGCTKQACSLRDHDKEIRRQGRRDPGGVDAGRGVAP
jgi:NAD(P)-dependent dehydrogenase (short-subunit alcohol dehydrogenase family)